MTKKNIIVKSVLGVVALILVGVMIAANIVLNTFSSILHQFFAGDTTDYSSATSQLEEGDTVVQRLAEDSMVLLKNEDFLPLSSNEKINLFGWAATDQGFLLVGGGSGGTVIATENKITLTQALKSEGVEYNEELLEAYSAISSVDADKNSNSPDSIAALTNPDSSFYTNERMTNAYAYSKTAVVVLSRFSGENASSSELISVGDYQNGTYLELTNAEKVMFDSLQDYGFDVVVLFNVCNNMEMGFLEDYSCIKAALYVGVPGQSGALAIPRILRGSVNPSGRTADTFPYDYQTNNPAYINPVYSNSSMVYQEGIYVGYKWYETADAEGFFSQVNNSYGEGYEGVVQYPFGYGLSYTDFEWTVDSVSWTESDDMSTDETYSMTVTVKNTGEVAGKDVVELYFTPPYTEGGIEKAEMNLLAFAKTDTIKPGESETVELTFTAYELAAYDAYDKNSNKFIGYEVENGDYYIKLMQNSHVEGPVVSGDYSYLLYSPGIEYENDPVTGAKVENRFTGDAAYADCPVDGSTAIAGGVDYLSRARDFANFPKVQVGSPNTSITNAAASYTYNGYDNADLSNIKYGEDANKYLVMVKEEDGTLSRASYEMLAGEVTAKLVMNEELMATLSDYDDEEAWNEFLNQLSQTEIAALIGRGGFQTVAIYSVGKPRCVDRDGPAGFNMGVTNTNTETKWTGFPTESLIGCSWNTDLTYRMGVVQGKIAASTKLQGWYGPGVNLHRSVYNTRNYEYYSEDSVLTGRLAAATVKGAKENNLYCYVKHLAVSEAGANPNDKNTWLTEQALREVYLKPFEMTVKDGGANGMMSAFNRVGAVWAGTNHALLTDVLRGEWGFRGTVITDWYQSSYMDYTRGIKAGNNLWLDGTYDRSAELNFSDTATAYCARLSAKNILYTYITTINTVSVTAAPYSSLFIFLWVLVNVVLAAGIVVCAVFIIKKPKKK